MATWSLCHPNSPALNTYRGNQNPSLVKTIHNLFCSNNSKVAIVSFSVIFEKTTYFAFYLSNYLEQTSVPIVDFNLCWQPRIIPQHKIHEGTDKRDCWWQIYCYFLGKHPNLVYWTYNVGYYLNKSNKKLKRGRKWPK